MRKKEPENADIRNTAKTDIPVNIPGKRRIKILGGKNHFKFSFRPFMFVMFLFMMMIIAFVAGFYYVQMKIDQNTISFHVETKPVGATVFVNGKKRGVSPVWLKGFESGEINIRLEKEGFETLEKKIEVNVGKDLLIFDLKPLSGLTTNRSIAVGPRQHIDYSMGNGVKP